MKNSKRLLMTVIAFVSVIAGVLLVNRWIDREIKDIAVNLPAPVQQTVGNTQRTGSGPRPVTIDPANDPLAPVIPRKQLKSSSKKIDPRPTSPQRIYEPAMDTVILTQ